MGNMDGVHLGHRAIIALVKNLALPQGLLTHVVSFDPHPRDYFAALGRGAPVQHIQSVRDRIEQLAALGVDALHLLRFNTALATLSPEDFVTQILVAACRARHVVVGKDVRFGHQRAGDLERLIQLGAQHGFAVHTLDDVVDSHARISSSTLRHALAAGDMPSAARLLGRSYSISGRVIHGRKLGRALGCPTMNLIPRIPSPALRGICVVRIHGLSSAPLLGVASLGLRPTVEQTTRFSLEVHAFGWHGDAYGKRVRVEFLHKLRDEAAYVDLPTLQIAIEKDMRDAQAWLAGNALA